MSANFLDQGRCDFRPERIHFQQPVPATLKSTGKLSVELPRFDQQLLERASSIILSQIVKPRTKLLQQLVSAFDVSFERVQSFVIPARQNFLSSARDVRNVDMDGFALADPI